MNWNLILKSGSFKETKYGFHETAVHPLHQMGSCNIIEFIGDKVVECSFEKSKY